MSDTLRDRKRLAKADRRREAVRRASEAAAARARAEDARQEDMAPSGLRSAVLDESGAVVRHARVELAPGVGGRPGASFIYSNPIKHLIARGERSEVPTITEAHGRAVDRLLIAWRVAGEGISAGVSSYGDVRGGGDRVGPGNAGIDQQIASRAEVAAAATWLGALWPVVRDVSLRGIDVSHWAGGARMDRKVAMGYLRAALDRLADFYKEPEKPSRIRTVEFGTRGNDE